MTTEYAHSGGGPEMAPTRLSTACVRVLPIDGAGLSVFSDGFRVPIGASGAAATTAERLQFTTGDGPCLQAHRHNLPNVSTAEQLQDRWPVYAAELLHRTPYASVLSYPLPLWGGVAGALDLYTTSRVPPVELRWDAVAAVAHQIGGALDSAPTATNAWGVEAPAWLNGPTAIQRQRVWIAVGALTAGSELSFADALDVLRAHAFSRSVTLDELSDDLISLRIDVADVIPLV